MDKIDSCHPLYLSKMINSGFRRKGGDRSKQDEVGYGFAYVYSNDQIRNMCKMEEATAFTDRQRANWIAYIVRLDNDKLAKQMVFDVSHHSRKGRTISAIHQFLDSTQGDLFDNDV